jgi:predicted nucleotidyltransferase
MNTQAITNLPTELQAPLSRLRDALVAAGDENLTALAVYGSVARGRWRAGKSDVNLLIVLRRASATDLDAIAPPLREAFRDIGVDPLILAADELPRAAAVFPSKFVEIQRYHILLHGTDVLAGLKFPRDAVLLRIEQEMQNLEMRLRRRYVAIRDDRQLLAAMLRDAAVPLSISLLALLEISGKDDLPDKSRSAIFRRAAEAFNLDGGVLEQLNALRHDAVPDNPAALFDDLLPVLRRVAGLPAKERANG